MLLWGAQHRDAQAEIETHPRFSPSIKVFTFPFAVPADGGCAAVVPVRPPPHPFISSADDVSGQGSHRTHLTAPAGIEREQPEKMPNHITFPAAAGTSVAYDNRIWVSQAPRLVGFFQPHQGWSESQRALMSMCAAQRFPKHIKRGPPLSHLLLWQVRHQPVGPGHCQRPPPPRR